MVTSIFREPSLSAPSQHQPLPWMVAAVALNLVFSSSTEPKLLLMAFLQQRRDFIRGLNTSHWRKDQGTALTEESQQEGWSLVSRRGPSCARIYNTGTSAPTSAASRGRYKHSLQAVVDVTTTVEPVHGARKRKTEHPGQLGSCRAVAAQGHTDLMADCKAICLPTSSSATALA